MFALFAVAHTNVAGAFHDISQFLLWHQHIFMKCFSIRRGYLEMPPRVFISPSQYMVTSKCQSTDHAHIDATDNHIFFHLSLSKACTSASSMEILNGHGRSGGVSSKWSFIHCSTKVLILHERKHEKEHEREYHMKENMKKNMRENVT